MQTTITEALADLKTIGKRLEAKRAFIQGCLMRQDALRDPHEAAGGSRVVIARERQAIFDLETRSISIRRAIMRANDATTIKVGAYERTIHDWLVWRREVAPGQKAFLHAMATKIRMARDEMQKKGLQFATGAENKPTDVIVNVTETELAAEIEQIEEILGTLDGQLSLKNATITIDVD